MATTDLSGPTRARILTAAWDRVRREGLEAVTLQSVARDAGVSRQLLYFHFGNRAGLLLALTRHHDRTSGLPGRLAAATRLPPVQGYVAVIRAWLAYLPDVLPVARALEAALVTGEAGGEAWRDRMGELREVLRAAVARLADADRLHPAWTVDEATDWTWARVQPSTYAHLVGERGWSAADHADRTVCSLLRDLVPDACSPSA
ncbi:TetR/AcrR family transcriptional regulator [Geodermatophilus sp. SYSU D00758]